MEKTCAELERELETEKKSLYVHNEGIYMHIHVCLAVFVKHFFMVCYDSEMKRILLNSEEQLRKYNELKLDNDSKETLIQVIVYIYMYSILMYRVYIHVLCT